MFSVVSDVFWALLLRGFRGASGCLRYCTNAAFDFYHVRCGLLRYALYALGFLSAFSFLQVNLIAMFSNYFTLSQKAVMYLFGGVVTSYIAHRGLWKISYQERYNMMVRMILRYMGGCMAVWTLAALVQCVGTLLNLIDPLASPTAEGMQKQFVQMGWM